LKKITDNHQRTPIETKTSKTNNPGNPPVKPIKTRKRHGELRASNPVILSTTLPEKLLITAEKP